MEDKYLYETFKHEASTFDKGFTRFLNEKGRNGWEYQNCFFCHDNTTSYASCIFKRQ